MPSPASRDHLGLALGFLGVVGFGGTLPATRLALDAFDPFFITAGRAALAGLCALLLLTVLRRPLPPRRLLGQLALASFGVVGGFPLFAALAMQSVPVAHGGVVLGVLPIAIALAGVVIMAERPSATYWIAAVSGAALVVAFALRHGGGDIMLGDLFLLCAIAAGAIGYAYSGRLTADMAGWEVISWALVLALPLTLALTFITWPANLAQAPAAPWAGFLYVALISQWLAFFPWNAAVAICGITRTAQIQLLQTFVTIGLAALINREAVDLTTLLFAAAVMVTVAISARSHTRLVSSTGSAG